MTVPVAEVQTLRAEVRRLESAVRREQAIANRERKTALRAEQRLLTERQQSTRLRAEIGAFLDLHDADDTGAIQAAIERFRAVAGPRPQVRPGLVRGIGKPPPLRTTDECWTHLQRLRRNVAKGLPEVEFWVEAESIVQIAETLVGSADG